MAKDKPKKPVATKPVAKKQPETKKAKAPAAPKAPKKPQVVQVADTVSAPAPAFIPQIGEMFLCDGAITSIQKDGTIVRHEVRDYVVTDNPLPFTSLEGHDCVKLESGEALRMLNG